MNPSLFISHVLENIADYVQRIYHFTFNLLVVTPTDLVLGNKAFIIIILTLIALSLFFLDISKTKEQLLVAFVKHKYVVLLHLVLLLGSIILCIIFYPSRHYLINQQFFLLLVALFAISSLRFRNKGYQFFFQKALPVFMLVLVLIVQGSITFRKYNANNTVLSHKKYEFIADKLKTVNNIWGLGIDFDVCFVKKGATPIVIIPPEEAIKTTFEEYVLKQKFNFIYVDSFLIEKTKIFKDTDTFLSSGYKKYFHKFDSPIKNEYLLIPIITK